MGGLQRAYESFRENVLYDPISPVLHDAVREGISPFRPRIVNLEVLPSITDFDTIVRIAAPQTPCLTKEFRLNEDELRDIVYGDSFGYLLAERIFKYYRYERPRQEPEANVQLGEN